MHITRRRWMARTAAWPALACAHGLVRAAPAAPGEIVQWPAVRLLDGEPWRPPAGHAVVAVFWSAHCEYCARHNVHIEKLHRTSAGRPLSVLGVSRDGSQRMAQHHVRERGYSFPVTLDVAELSQALSQRRIMPLTVTVDRRGRLRQVIPGEMFEADVMELLPRLTE
jgi:peroxiredoxin